MYLIFLKININKGTEIVVNAEYIKALSFLIWKFLKSLFVTDTIIIDKVNINWDDIV